MISIDLLKKHLNIDKEFVDDDQLLMLYAETAEHAVLIELDMQNPDDALDEYGNYKSEILLSILLLAGSLYNNREATSYAPANIVPLAYEYLNMLNKDYSYRD